MQVVARKNKTSSRNFLSLYPIFFLTIASGATPIESADRAPNDNEVIKLTEHALEQVIDYIVRR
jgi:hypothetical protein